MFPGLNPKKMQAVMKQMGIAQEEIDANRVVIECDDKNIVIENPSIIKIKMQGQENFQIFGDVSETEKDSNENNEKSEKDKTEEDIQTIIEKTGVTKEEAKKALQNANEDLTEALINLG